MVVVFNDCAGAEPSRAMQDSVDAAARLEAMAGGINGNVGPVWDPV